MRRTFHVLALVILATPFTPVLGQSQAEDHAQIARTLNYYLVGGTNNDFATLEKAFHTEATMKFMRDGEYKSVNALDFFRKGIKPGPPQDRLTSIVSIDISGNAAQARLLIDYATFRFHDYMQLLKIRGEWKIISKTFYKEDK